MRNDNLNWDDAKIWQGKANENKDEHNEPTWSWDCSFKLDFDGPILDVSSRFYPPHKNKDGGWEGELTICIGEGEVERKKFKTEELNDLKNQVEEFVDNFRKQLIESFRKKEEYGVLNKDYAILNEDYVKDLVKLLRSDPAMDEDDHLKTYEPLDNYLCELLQRDGCILKGIIGALEMYLQK